VGDASSVKSLSDRDSAPNPAAGAYTLCPKKRPPFYFQITLSKIN